MALFTNATDIRSLCWRGDQLVDWVGGGRAFAPDGTEQPASVSYGYRFDAATTSPDGRFAVIYERLGTKRLLLIVYDVSKRACLQAFQLDGPAGTILALGKRYVLSLYRHPKLVDLSTGKIVHMWTDLRSGLQDGSIVWHLDESCEAASHGLRSRNLPLCNREWRHCHADRVQSFRN